MDTCGDVRINLASIFVKKVGLNSEFSDKNLVDSGWLLYNKIYRNAWLSRNCITKHGKEKKL